MFLSLIVQILILKNILLLDCAHVYAKNKKKTKQRIKINEHWSKDFLLGVPYFGEIMSRERLLLLMRILNVSESSVHTGGDQLYKIRNVIGRLRS